MIKKKTLITQDFKVDFNYEIDDVLLVKEMYVVLLRLPKGTKELDNVYGLDLCGNISWRIQSVTDAFNIEQNTPYIALDKLNNDKIIVTNFFGMKYTVDVENGFLTDKECIAW